MKNSRDFGKILLIYSGNQCFRVIKIIIHAKHFIEDIIMRNGHYAYNIQ